MSAVFHGAGTRSTCPHSVQATMAFEVDPSGTSTVHRQQGHSCSGIDFPGWYYHSNLRKYTCWNSFLTKRPTGISTAGRACDDLLHLATPVPWLSKIRAWLTSTRT